MPRRWWLAMIGLGLAGTVGAVNPRPEGPPHNEAVDDAAQFSLKLMQFSRAVRAQYYRDVPRSDLLAAALEGVYETCRQPAPPTLRSELRRFDDAERIVNELLPALAPSWLSELALPRDTPRFEYETMRHVAARRVEIGRVEHLPRGRALLAAAQASVRALDPYCGLSPANRRRPQIIGEDEGEFGIGLELVNGAAGDESLADRAPGTFPAALLIKSVVPGSPAQKAGLRPEDRIVRVDGRPTAQLDGARYFQAFVAGERGQNRSHTFEVLRPGRTEPLTVKLRATGFYPECVFGVSRDIDGTWDYILDEPRKLGYIRVGFIETLAVDQLSAALRSLRARQAEGLILDLRWCPGGYLDPAIGLAKAFLPPEAIVATERRRDRNGPVSNFSTAGPPIFDLPIVVLINGETMGGGELLAAALQDHRRAVVAGDRTLGKATIQQSLTPSPLDGLTFKISVGLLVRPSGVSYQRGPDDRPTDPWGVRPDPGRWLPLSAATSAQLRELWMLQTLRPGDDRSALPSDDPEFDPQLRAALEMLRELTRKKS